jgi:uncharacterized surface protein with fasciclin (FAS1) repeats
MNRRIASIATGVALAAASLLTREAPNVLASQSKMPTGTAPGNVVETLASTGRFTTLIRIINSAGLTQTLTDKGPLTLFAPDDKSFSLLSKQTVKMLLTDPRAARGFILPYIVSGRITSKEMASPQWTGPVETMAGKPGSIRRGNGVLVYEAPSIAVGPSTAINSELDPNPGTAVGPSTEAKQYRWPCCGRIISADHVASNGIVHEIEWGD